jgi:hypothetical protein
MDEAQRSLVEVSRRSEKRITPPSLMVKEEVLLAEIVFATCSSMAWLIFGPEGGGNMFLRNVGKLLADYMRHITEYPTLPLSVSFLQSINFRRSVKGLSV